MSKLLVTTVCTLLALPVAAIADDGRPPQAHYQQGGGEAPPPYRGGEHHYDHDHGDHDRYGGDHDRYGDIRYYGYAPHYYAGAPHYYGYAGAPAYYYGGGHHHENDDALWAIGGLVLGAVIGHAIEHSSATAPVPAASASQHTQQCKDSVAYESDGTPYVKRDCR